MDKGQTIDRPTVVPDETDQLTRRSMLCGLALMAARPAKFTNMLLKQSRVERPVSETKAGSEAVRAGTESLAASRRFVMLGDTCGQGKGVQADQFGVLARRIARLDPRPEFIVHLGDHIWGLTGDEADLRAQWGEWWSASASLGTLPVHHLTGNHTCFNALSRRIFSEEVVAHLLKGTEPEMDGLQSVWRAGDVLMVLADTTFEQSGQHGRIDSRWVEEALTRHADARYKFVAGHFPAFPVNGFKMPCWRIRASDAERLWEVLVKHKVAAYFCAHVIAFDVQIHRGIPQICSAGGGYPLLYPPQTEYFHYAQIEFSPRRLGWRTSDLLGKVRERGQWPFDCPSTVTWLALREQGAALPQADTLPQKAADGILLLHFEGQGAERAFAEQTLLTGWNDSDAPVAIWVGFVCNRLEVRISPRRGDPLLRWYGPSISEGRLSFDLALHGALGSGGVLIREQETASWNSLESESAYGFGELTWPRRWSTGLAHTGYARNANPAILKLLKYQTGIVERVSPFLGRDLRVCARLLQSPPV